MIVLSGLQQAILAFGLFVAAALLAAAALSGRDSDRFSARLRQVVRQASGDAAAKTAAPSAAPPRREAARALLRQVAALVKRLPLLGRSDQDAIRRTLVQAGMRGREAVALYVAAKVLGFGAGAALAGGTIVVTGALDPMMGIAATIGSGFVGGLVPEIIVKRRAAGRREAIANTLPDALDLMIICANAGYSLDTAVQRVGREMARFSPALADELTVTAGEMQRLSDRREALDNLMERTNVQAVRSLVVTLVQAQRYGTPLTQALRTLAKEERNNRILALEERAGRLPALISLPLMVLIMPAVLIVVAGPAFIDILRGL